MAGIVGIAQSGRTELVEEMLDAIALRVRPGGKSYGRRPPLLV